MSDPVNLRPARVFRIVRDIRQTTEFGIRSTLPRHIKTTFLNRLITGFLNQFMDIIGKYNFGRFDFADVRIVPLLKELSETIDRKKGFLGWARDDEQYDQLQALNRVIDASSQLLEIFTDEYLKTEKAASERQLAKSGVSGSHSLRRISEVEACSPNIPGVNESAYRIALGERQRLADYQSRLISEIKRRDAFLDSARNWLEQIYDNAIILAGQVSDPPIILP